VGVQIGVPQFAGAAGYFNDEALRAFAAALLAAADARGGTAYWLACRPEAGATPRSAGRWGGRGAVRSLAMARRRRRYRWRNHPHSYHRVLRG
jgi:hypothetical protein